MFNQELMLAETLAELAKFDHIDFDEKTHSYSVGPQRLISVTQLLESYKKPFDSQYWAQIKANERGVAATTILAEWAAKSHQAQVRGTLFHAYMEQSLSSIAPLGRISESLDLAELIGLADKFLQDIRGKMTAVKSEFRVGDLKLGIAGTIDQLFYNYKSQQLELWDWKSNSKIAQQSRYKLINGLEHLADCELAVYSLQLEMYRQLLITNCNLKLGNCYIAWFNPDNENYKIFKTLDLQAEVALIFQQHRQKAVLIET